MLDNLVSLDYIVSMENTKKSLAVARSRENRKCAETEFLESARLKGLTVMRMKVPCFAFYDKGNLILVEVKTGKNHKIHKDKWGIMQHLSKHGIKCYKWSPDNNWIINNHNTDTPVT
jgi:hypothetical protein